LRKLNFFLKLFIAFFLFTFALWYDHILYNLIIGSILVITLLIEKISPFRFRHQIWIFSIFLLIIFLFQSFNGYGKILLNLPFHLTITEEGILTAFKFVTQILLIFLLFGTAIYSSRKEEILFYFRKPLKIHRIIEQSIEKFFRIGMFSFYMLPKSLKIQSNFSKSLRSNPKIKGHKISQRVNLVFESIYKFIEAIIKNSEQEYPEFVVQSKTATSYSPLPLVSMKNVFILSSMLAVHAILLWRF
jgi:hypothetical protein